MSIALAGLLALCALTMSVAGWALSLALVIRRHRSCMAADGRRRLRRPTTQIALAAVLVMLVSTALPWLSGSTLGVQLPSTLWGIPWVRWVVLVPTVLAALGTALLPHERFAAAQLCAATFTACSVAVGAVVFFLIAAAQRTSTWATAMTHVAGEVVSQVDPSHHVTLLIRAGVGSFLYVPAALVALGALAWGYRRDPGLSDGAEDTAAWPSPAVPAPRATDDPDSRFRVDADWWER